MKKAIFKKLAELEIQKRQIEDQTASLRKQALDEMQKEGIDTVESEYGKFFTQKRKSWTFSAAVEEAETKVKDMKKEEQESGIATFEEAVSLVFKTAKAE